MAIGSYSGKGQGELGLLRTLMNSFRRGDVLLADRLMCSWAKMAALHYYLVAGDRWLCTMCLEKAPIITWKIAALSKVEGNDQQ